MRFGQAAEAEGGIVLRVSSLEDTLQCKIRAWSDPKRRQSKRLKDLADIAKIIESHPELWESLPPDLSSKIEAPSSDVTFQI